MERLFVARGTQSHLFYSILPFIKLLSSFYHSLYILYNFSFELICCYNGRDTLGMRESIKKWCFWKWCSLEKFFFFRHDRVFWSQWLRKLTVWKVTYSPPVFSFLLSLTERLLIAWLRINKNSWYTIYISSRFS